MVEWHVRDEWTPTDRGGSFQAGYQLQGVACHWPGTSTDEYGIEGEGVIADRLRGWRHYHVTGRGWS